MINHLAGRDTRIMAQRAVGANYAHVVKRRLGKVRMHNTRSAMAHGAILVGRYVIKELTHTAHIVVAIRAGKLGNIAS